MRRLIAHVSLAFTTLVAVGATFVNVLTKINSNMEYQSGREITFKIEKKEAVADAPEIDAEGNAVNEIAGIMKDRLNIAKVTSYELATIGNDTIKLTLSQEKAEDYSYISHYLTFDGNLALSYGNEYITADEFLVEGKQAAIETYNNVPCITIPVNKDSSDYEALIEKIKTDVDENNTEFAEEEAAAEEGADPTHVYYLTLWYDFVEGKCTYEASQNQGDPYNTHVLMKIRYDGDENMFYFPGSGNKDKLYTAINLDTNGDSVQTVEEKEYGYKQANYYVNLINSSDLNYNVKVYFDQPVTINASVESLIGYTNDGNHLTVAWSSTFASTLCAILILTFLLIVYYRLGALSISTISITSTFLSLLAVVLFKAEFNTFGIIGLAIVAIASIVSGGIYAHKLKEECYRGRTLKKANAEASKKSLLPIVDVNVIVVVLGIFLYIFGGALLRSFAVITVFGGLISLLLNTLGLKGMYWLITNASKLQGNYEMFGVDSRLVPNLINEEKQTFFGPYADKDLTKKKTPVGIVAAALLLASTAGLAVFGGLSMAGKDDMYKKGTKELPAAIYFETNNESSKLAEGATVKNILDSIIVYDEGSTASQGTSILRGYISSTGKVDGVDQYNFTLYTRADMDEEEEVEVTYYIYAIELNKALDDNKMIAYRTGEGTEGNPYKYDSFVYNEDKTATENLVELLDDIKTPLDSSDKSSITLKTNNKIYAQSEIEFGPVALGVLVASAVLAVYFMLRYGLSRGLTALIASLSIGVITTGLLTLFRFLAIPSYVVAAGPFVVAFTLMIAVVFMNREKEMIAEDKNHDNSPANRKEIMVKATSSALAATLPMIVFALYLGINFFGFGPIGTSWIYLMIIVGVVLAGLVVTMLYGPIAHFFYSLFNKVASAKPKKAKKAKSSARVNKSAEPEEAVFIGIND